MKKRYGFVSNSSSASFIVAVDKSVGNWEKQLALEGWMDTYFKGEGMAAMVAGLATEGPFDWADLEERQQGLIDREDLLDGSPRGNWRYYLGGASYNQTDNPVELAIGNGAGKPNGLVRWAVEWI